MLSKFNLPTNSDLSINALQHDKILLKGNGATLTTDVTVSLTGTPYEGLQIELIFDSGGVDVNGRILTVFDEVLTDFADKNFRVLAIYLDSAWKVSVTNITPTSLLTPFQIADGSITGVKIADNAITPAKASSNLRKETFFVEIDTTGGLKDAERAIWIDYPFKVIKVGFIVLEQMVSNSLITTFEIGSLGQVHSQIITSIFPVGTKTTVSADDPNIESVAGDYLKIFPSKTTSGGRAGFTITIEKV